MKDGDIGRFVKLAVFSEIRNIEEFLPYLFVTDDNSIFFGEIFKQSLVDERLEDLFLKPHLFGRRLIKFTARRPVVLLVEVAVGRLELLHRDGYVADFRDIVGHAAVPIGSPTDKTGTYECNGADPDRYDKIFSVLLHPADHKRPC